MQCSLNHIYSEVNSLCGTWFRIATLQPLSSPGLRCWQERFKTTEESSTVIKLLPMLHIMLCWKPFCKYCCRRSEGSAASLPKPASPRRLEVSAGCGRWAGKGITGGITGKASRETRVRKELERQGGSSSSGACWILSPPFQTSLMAYLEVNIIWKNKQTKNFSIIFPWISSPKSLDAVHVFWNLHC